MRGRIVVTPAVVLSRRPFREADRISFLFTEDFGRIPVRYISVDRQRGKLRALSEPLTWGQHRLHVRDGAEFSTAAGGALITTFPRLREDLSLTLRGLEACEVLTLLTPLWKPAPRKYELITSCLLALEAASPDVASWIVVAFTLQLLEAAGFGVGHRRVSEQNRELWERLHSSDLTALADLPSDPGRRTRLEAYCRRSVETIAQRALRVPACMGGSSSRSRFARVR